MGAFSKFFANAVVAGMFWWDLVVNRVIQNILILVSSKLANFKGVTGSQYPFEYFRYTDKTKVCLRFIKALFQFPARVDIIAVDTG